jgi:uncharacterized protein (DUF58 family)
MITRRGAALAVGSLALGLLGRFLGLRELYVVAVAGVTLVAAGLLVVRVGGATVGARRTLGSARLGHGAEATVTLELRNPAHVPAPLLLVSDDCPRALRAGDTAVRFVAPGLGPRRSAVLRYDLHATRRGRYALGPLRVRVRDPFGLAERGRTYPLRDELLVHPRVEALGDGLRRGLHRGSGHSETNRLLDTGDEFHTMREYVTGDDLRRVHWPSTARRRKLMVRQHEQPWEAEASVLCDTRGAVHGRTGPSASLEQAVSASASVAAHLAGRGYHLRFLTDAERRSPVLCAAPAVLDRLAEVGASPGASLAPALELLRSSGASGLLVAVVAPPPGDAAVGTHADVRMLLRTGRAFRARVALVVTPVGARRRAAELAALLAAAGWRALALAPGEDLAPGWRGLMAAPARRVVPAP